MMSVNTYANTDSQFRIGDEVLVSPQISEETDWLPAVVMRVDENPFIKQLITVRTADNIIYFDQPKYFRHAK